MGRQLKALVTGATGFVGGAICRGLISQGWEVRAFRRENSLLTLLNGLPVEHVIGDLAQPETIIPAVEGVDAVFHAGAMMNGGSDLDQIKRVTVAGTRNLLEIALAAQVKRFVHISSVAALGVPVPLPYGVKSVEMDETHAWNELPEHWAYGYAKYLAEMEVQRAVSHGLDAVIVNPSVVLGAGDIYRQNSSIIQKVSQGKIHVSVDSGLALIHIEDIVSGVLAAWQYGTTGERYILSALNTTVTSFLKLIAQVTGVQPPQLILPAGLLHAVRGAYRLADHFIDLPVEPELLYQVGKYFYYSNQKAKTKLNWQPVHTIESAVRDAYAWFKYPLSLPYSTDENKEGMQTSM